MRTKRGEKERGWNREKRRERERKERRDNTLVFIA